MSRTARQIIEDAMGKISVFPDEASIENSEIQLFLRELNEMMYEWDSIGYKLGYKTITSVSDVVAVPNYAISAIKYNLAVRVAPDFLGSDAPMSVQNLAKKSMRTIRNNATKRGPVNYHENMPFGSGNFYEPMNESVYDDLIPSLYLDNTGITVTIATADTPTIIGSGWTEEQANAFDTTSAGRATFNGYHEVIHFKASIYAEVASGTDDLTFYIARNGVPYELSAVQVSSTAGTNQEIKISHEIEMWKDDYVELYCKNNDTTENITINSAKLRI